MLIKIIIVLFFIVLFLFLKRFYESFDLFYLLMDPVALFVGTPGSGKSTLAAALAHFHLSHFAKKHKYSKRFNTDVFSNVDILDTYKVDKSDIGNVLIADGVLLVDEAGVDFNGRKWKDMSSAVIKYLKEIRHYNIRYLWFSQDLDCDATIRRLAAKIYIVTKIGPFIRIKPIACKFDIDENTHDLAKFFFKPAFLDSLTNKYLRVRHVFAPKYFKYFDSFERYELPIKKFPYKPYVKPEGCLKIILKKFKKGIDNVYNYIYNKIQKVIIHFQSKSPF